MASLWKIRVLILIILVNLVSCQVNGTYKEVTANLFGRTYYYDIIEAEFPDELYLLQQRACPCQTGECPAASIPDTNNNTNFIPLIENEWAIINGTLEIQHFQFVVPRRSGPCPVVVIALDPFVGTPPNIKVAAGQYPTRDNFLLASVFYGNQDIWICDFKFTFGVYYVEVAPANQNLFTSYRVRYYLLDPLPCIPPLPDPYPSNGNFEWLHDGEAKNSWTHPGTTVPFKFFVNQSCANVTVAVYKTSSYGDVDVSGDLVLSSPSGKAARWVSASDADDSIAFSYCTDQPNFVINVGISVWYGPENTTFVVVATTRIFLPLSTTNYTYRKVIAALAWGSSYLECPGYKEECNFPAYESCQYDRGNYFGCCQSLYPLAPTSSPNPIFPWNVADESLPWMSTIPWDEPLSMVPNKLSWALYLGYITPTSVNMKYSVLPDLTQCVIKFKNRVITKDGMPVESFVSLKKKELSCNITKFNHITTEMNGIISKMYNEEDILDLSLYQAELVILNLDDDFSGCRELVVDRVQVNWQNVSYTNSTSCLEDVDDTYHCCPNAQEDILDICCLPGSYSKQKNTLSLDPSVSSDTSCVTKKTSNYASVYNAIDNCNVQFHNTADLEIKTNLKQFIIDCRNTYVGEIALGIPCNSDADCPNSCDPITKKCLHNDTLILQCFAEKIDLVLMRLLKNKWGSNDTSNNRDDFVKTFEQYLIRPLCTGPTGIKYQNHYEFTSPNLCTDCVEPACYDTSCTIPLACSYLVSTCQRFWTFFPENPGMCLSDKKCNWMDCSGSDCKEACLNATLPDHVCVNCAGGTCVEVPNFDQQMCTEGLCSLSQYSATDCLSQYECSLPCPNCTEEQCFALGTCSDTDQILSYLSAFPNATGVCFTPLLNDWSSPYCANTADVVFPYACADSLYQNETACLEVGGTWREPAYTRENCLSFQINNSSYGVYLSDLETFTRIPEDVGLTCGLEVLPYVTWTGATTNRGQIQQLVWIKREYNSSNSITNTIDYHFLDTSIDSAIGEIFSYAYVTEGLCRYIQSSTLISEIACLKDSKDCKESTFNAPVQSGVGLVCSGLPTLIQNDYYDVFIGAASLPAAASCDSVGLYSISSSQFQNLKGLRLSSEIFKPAVPNPISVVLNSNGALVGQLVSNGMLFKMGFNDRYYFPSPVEICFYLDKTRFIESDTYKIYGIGSLMDNKIYFNTTAQLVSENKICSNVSYTGTYFAIKVQNSWETALPYDISTVYQAYASAIIFIIVFFVAIFQMAMLIIYEKKKFLFKMLSMCLLLIFLLTRFAYMILFGLNQDDANTSLVLYEFPTFLFFLEYFSVLYIWLLVLVEVRLLGKKTKVPFIIFTVSNIFVSLLFVIFIVIFYSLPEYYTPQPCDSNSLRYTSRERGVTNLVYQIVISALLIIIASVFVVVGAQFLGRLKAKIKGSSGPAILKLYYTTIILVMCFALCFLLRSILTLIALLTTYLPSIVGMSILEALPSLALALYLFPHGYLHIKHSSSDRTTRSSRTFSNAVNPQS